MSSRSRHRDRSAGAKEAQHPPAPFRAVPTMDDDALAAAIDLIPTAAFISRRSDGQVLRYNALVEPLFGLSPGELAGGTVSDYYRDASERPAFLDQLEHDVTVTGRVIEGSRADGGECWLESSHRAVEYRGEPAILTVFADITAVKAAQEASAAEEKRVAALAEISRMLSVPRITHAVLDGVCEMVRSFVPFDRLGIGLIDRDKNEFSLAYAAGATIPGRVSGGHFSISGSVTETLMETRSPVLLDGDDPDALLKLYPSLTAGFKAGMHSFMAVPLISGEDVIGTITFRDTTPCSYADHHVRFAERIASHLAPALEKNRLHEELERETRERETVAEIGRVVSQSPDVTTVYDRFARLITTLVPADRVVLVMLSADGERFSDLYVSGTEVPELTLRNAEEMSRTVTAHASRTRRPVLFHPAAFEDVEARFPVLDREYRVGLRSFLSVPLVVEEQAVGVLHLRSREEMAYTERHALLAESVAAQIAGTVASHRSRDEERQDAHAHEVLAQIGKVISSSLDIRAVYEGFARRVNEVVPCERLVITTLDNDKGTATDTYVYGAAVPGWSEGTVHQVAGSAFEEVARTGRTSVRSDIGEEPPIDSAVRDALMRSGLRSSIMTPLVSNGEVIGTLNLKCAAPDVYTRRHVELAERIADQIAGAIANSRLYSDLQRVANERRALAAIGLAATQDLDLDGVFTRTADSLRGVVDYDRLSVTLFGPDDGVLRVAFVRGELLAHFRPGAVVTPAEGDPSNGGSWTWQSGLLTSDRPDGRLRAVVQAALGSRSRHLGYIRLRSNTTGAYDERSVEMLERVATYLTPAIQNALEHRQALRLAEERERSLLLDRENRELHRLDQAKSHFLSTVSHELKTPLTSIVAFTDILLKNRQGGMSDRDLFHLRVMERNGRRLGLLIDDLLDLSRLDRGMLRLAQSDIDIGELVRELVTGFRPITDAKSQQLEWALPGEQTWIRADRDRIAQVLSNLLSNASKYSPAETRITLTVRRSGDRLHFAVEDRGIGISAHDQRSLFTMFFRADNEATRSEPGTGLGLYIAKSIVDLHGGTFALNSSPGQGTTVGFTVPGVLAGRPDAPVDGPDRREPGGEVIPWSRLTDAPPAAAAG